VLADDFRRIKNEHMRVVLIESTDHLLPGGFDQTLRESAKRQLEALGAEVRLSARVTAIDEHGVSLGNERIEATTVIWTAGVRAKRLTETLGAELDKSK
jgi:NADH dehydrogenase